MRDAAADAKATKEAGKRLFAPELGGSFAVFEVRPLAPALVKYCAYDVKYFELLEKELFGSLDSKWQLWVLEKSLQRVYDCIKPGFRSASRENAIAPV